MFTFKKNERLHNFRLIKKLNEEGIILVENEVLKIRYLLVNANEIVNNSQKIQILVEIPKKKIKKAVDRNLLKRRIREIFRLNKCFIKLKEDYTILIKMQYSSNEIKSFKYLKEILLAAFAKI